MKKVKKILVYISTYALVAALAIAGTIAYLTDTDENTNIMTLGNVDIVQVEQERVNVNDADEQHELQGFTRDKPLYPAVYDGESIPWAPEGEWVEANDQAWKVVTDNTNVVDKFVSVTNIGESDAYVRTLFAIEVGENEMAAPYLHLVMNGPNVTEGPTWQWNWIKDEYGEYVTAEIEGSVYRFYEAVYTGILKPGETTIPSLKQVYLDKEATNEVVESLGEDFKIIVLSQAIQTKGFEGITSKMRTVVSDAKYALDEGFGVPEAMNADVDPLRNVVEWFMSVKVALITYNGESYESLVDALNAAKENGGVITLNGDYEISETINIPSNITIDGNGNTIRRNNEFTGNMFIVKTGMTLSLNDIAIDGGAVWSGDVDSTLNRGTVNNGIVATGFIVGTEGNAHIVLNEGAVLKNNDGTHAVNLNTRVGATLTLNGGEIINNNSGAGAIWGGGHITVNSGKINGNSSTGSAGAIRMVSNCNFTMNGGEMSNNKAAASGGAIWGYGASTYNLKGGTIANNEAASGGFIYTGDSSTVKLGGTNIINNKADDAGAFRLSNRTSFIMTDGKLAGNISENNPENNGFYGWNPGVNISGGSLEDDIFIQGGLTPIVGGNGVTGVIHFDLSTNHNTVNLHKEFGKIRFDVVEDTNFLSFNMKAASDYVYTEGDENKLVCLNDGYTMVWDSSARTFKITQK